MTSWGMKLEIAYILHNKMVSFLKVVIDGKDDEDSESDNRM